MIGKLTGRLDSISLSAAIVDVGGVGYEVTVGARTLTSLPPVGETVTFAIDTHVREDEISGRLEQGGSAESICRDLVELALARGGEDNVTVVIGKVRTS